MTDETPSWAQLGRRIGAVRTALERSVEWLAGNTDLSVLELRQVEAGLREMRPIELARIARALGLGVDWFLTEPPPAVRSLRADRVEGPRIARIDLLLEGLARDVELLRSLGFLPEPMARKLPRLSDIEDTEAAARTVREWLGADSGPLQDLDRAAERLGVHTFCAALGNTDPDGAYVALDGGGVVVVNGQQHRGRRRFTLAHELGHHVFQDEYSTDWLAAGSQDAERLVNAFAVHLLLPRSSVVSRWNELITALEPRMVALTLAVEYRVSWSVVCAQCARFRLLDPSQQQSFGDWTPSRADFMELGLRVTEELIPPCLSPAFTRAVLAAHRKNRITAHRAIEMLRGTLEHSELPIPDEVPLQAYLTELETP